MLLFVLSQGYSQNDSIEFNNIKISKELEQKSRAWLDDLYTSNVIVKGDSITYNDEAKLLISDSKYYNLIYPKVYTWPYTLALMEKKALKQALWYMINLYGEDKVKNSSHIINTIITLDQTIDMEKVLVNSYYSYISFDPEVVKMENGKVKEFSRPDIGEEKLNHVKELTRILLNVRRNKAETLKRN